MKCGQLQIDALKRYTNATIGRRPDLSIPTKRYICDQQAATQQADLAFIAPHWSQAIRLRDP